MRRSSSSSISRPLRGVFRVLPLVLFQRAPVYLPNFPTASSGVQGQVPLPAGLGARRCLRHPPCAIRPRQVSAGCLSNETPWAGLGKKCNSCSAGFGTSRGILLLRLSCSGQVFSVCERSEMRWCIIRTQASWSTPLTVGSSRLYPGSHTSLTCG